MDKPKPINFSLVVLTLLFVLSQTVFALSNIDLGESEGNSQKSEIQVSSIDSFNYDNEILASRFSINSNSNNQSIALAQANEDEQITSIQETQEIAQPATFAAAMAEVSNPQTVTSETAPSSTPAPSATPAPEKKVKGVVRYVNANKLNVRKEATSDSELVTSIKRGDKVTYYETVGKWARIITWTDKPGYVLAEYLVDSANKVDKVVEQKTPSRSSPPASQPVSAEGKTLAENIVNYAKSLLGVKYVYGGYSTKGFDCSGFTKYVFAKYGIYVPRSSWEYYNFGTKVSRSDLQPGDIVLWDINGGSPDVGHVGIYIGNGMFIHASSSKGKVVTRSLASYGEKYMGARRVIK